MGNFNLDVDRARELRREADSVYFKTSLGFMLNQNGHRRGKISTWIGVPSGGKSTLRNSLIIDFAICNPDRKIFIWLSEESFEDFNMDMASNADCIKYLKNINIYSEQDNHTELGDQIDTINTLKNEIVRIEPDLIIIDNATTSGLYGFSPSSEAKFSSDIKKINASNNSACVIFAHTGGDTKSGQSRMIDQNDIRGSKTLVNLSEFFFILQSFSIGGAVKTTLRRTKHRGMVIEDNMFGLAFDPKRRIYKDSYPLEFKKIKEYFKNQETINGR